MISERTAKMYCCEDPSLIENYYKAINDETQTWQIHHRRAIDENKSVKQLIDEGLYYYRPASELIFLTKSDHRRLHKNVSAETRKKQSESKKGENHPMYGKHHTEEAKRKMSEAHKGEKNPNYGRRGKDCPNYGKPKSEETRKKISEAMKGENHPLYGKKYII